MLTPPAVAICGQPPPNPLPSPSTSLAPPPRRRTALGPFLLTLLFQGSTWYTERLSAAKYADYKYYQQTTSRLVPLPGPVPFREGGGAGTEGSAVSPRRNMRRSVRDK